MSKNLKFPIPDWGEETFNYPSTNINGEINIKPKKRKRKHDSESILGKGQPGNNEALQQVSKKKKSGKTVLLPENKKAEAVKNYNNTKTTEILTHQEKNHGKANTKPLLKKRKRNRKNNKYKELNERQKAERMAKAGLVGDESESKEQGMMRIKKNKGATQPFTKKEEAQHSEAKEIKKKKKKSKLLKNTRDNIPEEDSDVQEVPVTSHQNGIHDMTKMDTPHSQTTSISAKKKKSAKKPSDIILLNGKETQSNHQNASSEITKHKKKSKGGKIGKETIGKREDVDTSMSGLESENVGTEAGTMKKKKKKEKTKESGKLVNGKDFDSSMSGLESENVSTEEGTKKRKKKEKIKENDELLNGKYLDSSMSGLESENVSTEAGTMKKKKKEKIKESGKLLNGKDLDSSMSGLESENVGTEAGTMKKKKKEKIKENDELLNGKHLDTSMSGLESENVSTEEGTKKRKKKEKIKESGKLLNGKYLDSSMSGLESENVSNEEGTMKKKKKKEKIKESDKLLSGKDNVSDTKRTNLEKQKKGLKSSKKAKEIEEDEEEELLFDGDEECSESFKKDLGALLSSLNFSDFKKTNSKKKRSNDDDGSDLEMNSEHETIERENDEEGDSEGKVKKEGLSKKRKRKRNKGHEILEMENAEEEDSEGEVKMEGLSKKRKKMNKGHEILEVEDDEGGSEDKVVESLTKKKKKKKENAKTNLNETEVENPDVSEEPATPVKKSAKFDRGRVAKLLEEAARMEREKPSPPAADTLKERMEGRLMAARFRMVNEELYTKSSGEAKQLFKKDPAAFDIYHQGYQAQVRQWPVNPLDIIIKWLAKKPKELVVADMGCGEATLSQRVPQSCVHSLDLVATKPWVTACDMAHTPVGATSVDVVVFCLSLMGTNIKDFLMEANRILKTGGIMKIAEVESRFNDVKEFEKLLVKYGFHCTARDTSHKYFFILDLKKNRKLKKTAILPDIILKPCLYKKR